MHADLRLAGSLPPLDAPHHMRATEWAMYREGVVVRSVPGEGSLLNVGLDKVGCLSVGHCTVVPLKHRNFDLHASSICSCVHADVCIIVKLQHVISACQQHSHAFVCR